MQKLRDRPEWNLVKIDLNELEKYGRKGLKYDRVEPEYITVEEETLK